MRCHVFLVSSSRREVLVSLNVKNALDFYAIQGLFFFEKSKFVVQPNWIFGHFSFEKFGGGDLSQNF